MCEFCDPKYIETPSDMTVRIRKFGETYGICFQINKTEEYGMAINFCPMCGQELVNGKTYYTPEDVDKMTLAQLADDAIWNRVKESMTKWNEKEFGGYNK